MSEPCPFCSPTIDDEVITDDGVCIAVATQEPPVGSVMVIPKAHRESPFEMTDVEWLSTRRLLNEMRGRLDSYDVAGWNIGWNVGATAGQLVSHAHCHLIPRYADEKYAGRGIRWWFKQADNHPR